jgi:ATP-dependent Clp protease adapter protein ClpS
MVDRTQTQARNSLTNQDRDNLTLSNRTQSQDGIQSHARGLLDKFVSSVQVLIEDITALEVNTMVVNRISGAKFSAWEAYQSIYSISDKDYFEEMGIPESPELRNRYRSLFSQLEREYFHILVEEGSYRSNPSQNEKVKRYHQRLLLSKVKKSQIVESDPRYIELARPILPAPAPVIDGMNQENQTNWQEEEWQKKVEELQKQEEEWQKNCDEIQVLFHNDKFMRTLRKVIELKAALDGGDIKSTKIDTIYAQTVMQLDGDIITRYHKDLFDLPEDAKSLILQIHNDGVVAGEQQWRGILDFMINLVKSLAIFPNGQR